MNKYITAALISLVGFSALATATENAMTDTPTINAEKTESSTDTSALAETPETSETSESSTISTQVSESTAAEDSATSTATENSTNTGAGFYIGVGVGTGAYSAAITDGDYYIDTDGDGSSSGSNIKGDDLDGLDDTSSTAIVYAGYQFNKIIAVEASYTDHGSYSGELDLTKGFKKKPESLAVYANAGYTFFNGQLRPFGLLGLGYIDTNQSRAYDLLGVDDTAVSLHMGGGVEYYPTALKGMGFRLAYTVDFFSDNNYESYEGRNGTLIRSTTLWQALDMLYVGAQYKF